MDDEAEPAPRKRRDDREWRFQRYAIAAIKKGAVPAPFVSAIDHAGQLTENGRARMALRGVRFGLPDLYVAQGDPHVHCWIELKRGTEPSATQRKVLLELRAAGANAYVAHTISGVFGALSMAGFRLHGNARNIVTEMEARLDAADAKPKKPRASSKPRRERVSTGKVTAYRRAGVLV